MDVGAVSTAGREAGSPCQASTTAGGDVHNLEDSCTSSTSFHTAVDESPVSEDKLNTPTSPESAEASVTCDASTRSVSDGEDTTCVAGTTSTGDHASFISDTDPHVEKFRDDVVSTPEGVATEDELHQHMSTCITAHTTSDRISEQRESEVNNTDSSLHDTVGSASREVTAGTPEPTKDGCEQPLEVKTDSEQAVEVKEEDSEQAVEVKEDLEQPMEVEESELAAEVAPTSPESAEASVTCDASTRSVSDGEDTTCVAGTTSTGDHGPFISDADPHMEKFRDNVVSTPEGVATEDKLHQHMSTCITAHTTSDRISEQRETEVNTDSSLHDTVGSASREVTAGTPEPTKDGCEQPLEVKTDSEQAVEVKEEDSEQAVEVKEDLEQPMEVEESELAMEVKDDSEPTVAVKEERELAVEVKGESGPTVAVKDDSEPAKEVKEESEPAKEGDPQVDMDVEESSNQCSEAQLTSNVPSKSIPISQNGGQSNELSVSDPSSSSNTPPLSPAKDTSFSEISTNKIDGLSEPQQEDNECVPPPSPPPPPLPVSEAASGGRNECEALSLSSSVSREVVGEGEGEGGIHTPSLSSSGYGGSRESSPEEGEMITEDMKAEEERLRERKSRDGSLESEAGELSHMKEYQRYMRLQHLLQKSSIYSKFLLDQMENQIKEKKKSSGKVRRKVIRGAAANEKREEKTAPPRRITRSRKRKADEPLELSNFMNEKGKLKQLKLDSGVAATAGSANKTKKATVEEKPEEKERYINGKVVPAAQPGLMTGGVMRPYQVEGMEWIKVLYENGVNGILADEMGLGKTLQVIGVIAHLIEMGVKGPFLVAAPLSTLPNWVSEFKKFTPEIPAILYHGTQLEREKLRRKMFKTKPKKGELDTLPVVVTSYEICMRDQRHLMYRNWRFLVVDEGHRIKNLNCKLIRALKSYDAANRLLLTGTPLQNNLSELWSLLNFILPDIFDDLNGFQSWFDFDVNGEDNREKIIAREREQNVLSKLHQILTPFLLRRLKTDVEFSLPPKKEVLVYAPLTSVQQKYYTSLLDKTIFDMVKGKGEKASSSLAEEDEGEREVSRHRRRTSHHSRYAQLNDEQFESLLTGDKSYEELVTPSDTTEHTQPVARVSATNIKLTNVWMMLRKCCNHPYLLEFPMTPDGQFRVDEELVTCCGKLMLLDRLLLALISGGHKTIVFSQFTTMLDILEDYLELRAISYGRLDGAMPFTERQRQMAVFQGDPDCRVFLTSTRAGGLGINLTAADTVIIYDSDWNPQADLQAQDRCHRIGQTKPVIVYRLVTANTFDQRIVERATSKRQLEKMVIHKGKFKGYSREDQQLSLDDLTSLLHSVDHQSIVDSNDAIISDEALEALLDRNPGLAKERGGEGVSEHKRVFKVIAEQDSSELSINTGTSDTAIKISEAATAISTGTGQAMPSPSTSTT